MPWIPDTPGEALLGRPLELLHGVAYAPGQEQVELTRNGGIYSYVDENGWATIVPMLYLPPNTGPDASPDPDEPNGGWRPASGFAMRASAECDGKAFRLRSSWALPGWARLCFDALLAAAPQGRVRRS